MSDYLLMGRDGASVNWTRNDSPPLTIVGDDVYMLEAVYDLVHEGEGEIDPYQGTATITLIGDTEILLAPENHVVVATSGRPEDDIYTEPGSHVFHPDDTIRGFLSNKDSLMVRGGVTSDANPGDDGDGMNAAWIVHVDGPELISSRVVTYPTGTVTRELLDGEERIEFRWDKRDEANGEDEGGIYVADPYTGDKLADEPDINDIGVGVDAITSARTVGWPAIVHGFAPEIPDPPTHPSVDVYLFGDSDGYSDPPPPVSYNGGPSNPATGKINMWFSNVVDPSAIPYAIPPEFWSSEGLQRPTWDYVAGEGATSSPITSVKLWMRYFGSAARLDNNDFSIFYRDEDVGGGPEVDAGIYTDVYGADKTFIGIDPEPESYFFVTVHTVESGEVDAADVNYDLFTFWINGAYTRVYPNPPLTPFRYISANPLYEPEDTDGIGNVQVLGDARFVGGNDVGPQRDRLLPYGFWTSLAALGSDGGDGTEDYIYTMMLHFEVAEPDPSGGSISVEFGFSRANFARRARV